MPSQSKQSTGPLTPGEMEIMQILWKTGGATIAETLAALDREIGYTTVQTRLNRLVNKGLAWKTAERPTSYRPAVAPERVSAGHLDLLLERVSDGSVVPLIAQLLKGRAFTAAEIAALKKLLDAQERKGVSDV